VVVPGQKVQFRDHFRVGDKFINTFTFHLGATLNVGGQAQKLTYKSFERYGQVVRAVDQNRHPTQVLRKYYVAYEMDQGQRTNKWYVNKILLLTRQGGRTVVRAKGGPVPAAVQQDLSDELKPLDLSDGPKAQGERWVLTERTLRQFMDLPPQARGTVRCRWSRTITSKAGHKVAVLTADLVLTMPLKAGLSMDLDLTGKLFYNLSLGKLEVVYLKGPVTIKGAVLQQGRRVAVQGKGQAKMIMIRRFGG